MVGRFQPCMHKGHLQMIKDMKYRPCVVMIDAPGTSQDKNKNPLTWDERYDIIQEALFPTYGDEVMFYEYHNGYIPDIIRMLREDDFDVKELIAGPDRIAEYKKKVDRLNQLLNTSDKISLEYVEARRITSSTEVRAAIRDNDVKTFKSLTHRRNWDYFDFLREKLSNDR